MAKTEYKYTAFMPLGHGSELIHLKATEYVTDAQFISIEQSSKGYSIYEEERGRTTRFFLTSSSLDEETVKSLVAKLNHCEPSQVEIRVIGGVRNRGNAIPNSSEYNSLS